MRRAARVDKNQGEIVEALRGVGAVVALTHQLGDGFPDAVVAFRGQWYLAEIKDGSKPPSARQLTDAEKAWHERFAPHAPIHIWESEDQALRAIGAIN